MKIIIFSAYDITRKIARNGVRPPPKQGFWEGFYGLDFRQFSSDDLLKKSEILECDPDVDKKIHGHRIFYAYTIFLHRKKVFLFFGINPEAFI